MAEVVARYVDCSRAEAPARRCRSEARAAARRARVGGAPAGALRPATARRRLAADGDRFVLDRPSGSELAASSTRRSTSSRRRRAGGAGRAMVLNDAPKPVDPHVFVRGNPGRPGKAVPRQFLKVLAGPDRKPFQKGSGRLELARAIVEPGQPADGPGDGQPGLALALRRRAWSTTPSDFGLRSDPPSHPELLDYLAAAFVDGGWSIKALHRRIMLSSTYQQRERPPARVPASATRRTACLAVQPPAARLRGDARRAPGRRRARSTRPIGGPLGRRSTSRRSRRAGPSTASSTARTSTASTAPSTSPAPTPPAPSGSSRPSRSRPSS